MYTLYNIQCIYGDLKLNMFFSCMQVNVDLSMKAFEFFKRLKEYADESSSFFRFIMAL